MTLARYELSFRLSRLGENFLYLSSNPFQFLQDKISSIIICQIIRHRDMHPRIWRIDSQMQIFNGFAFNLNFDICYFYGVH